MLGMGKNWKQFLFSWQCDCVIRVIRFPPDKYGVPEVDQLRTVVGRLVGVCICFFTAEHGQDSSSDQRLYVKWYSFSTVLFIFLRRKI